jgi:drug/metabolite transporter (DMT)-like permease
MNIFERNSKKIVFAAVIAASFSAIFVRLINAPALAIGFYRLTFSLPFFAITVFGWYRKELASISIKDLAGTMLAGFFLAGHFFSWFTALAHTTVASATVICLTHPIVILIINFLIFREKSSSKVVIGILVAFLGSVIISGGDYNLSHEAIFGDFMAFMGAIFMALHFLTGRRFRKNVNAAVYVFLVFCSCWMVFGIGMIGTGTSFTAYTMTDFMWIILMTLLCQIGSHAMFNWSLGYVSPLYVSTCKNWEGLISTLLAAFIFAEIPTAWQVIGGIITISGLLYYAFNERDSEILKASVEREFNGIRRR